MFNVVVMVCLSAPTSPGMICRSYIRQHPMPLEACQAEISNGEDRIAAVLTENGYGPMIAMIEGWCVLDPGIPA